MMVIALAVGLSIVAVVAMLGFLAHATDRGDPQRTESLSPQAHQAADFTEADD